MMSENEIRKLYHETQVDLERYKKRIDCPQDRDYIKFQEGYLMALRTIL